MGEPQALRQNPTVTSLCSDDERCGPCKDSLRNEHQLHRYTLKRFHSTQ